jgi:cold shock CspA family protein
VPDVRLGTVSAFDPDRGLGEVTGEDGSTLSFHCTAIADGSRHVDTGTPVCFAVVPGHLGQMEAAVVTPLPRPPTGK